jgi:hypothetical protein
VAEGAPLLREYVGKTCIEGSNPSGSARQQIDKGPDGPLFVGGRLVDERAQRAGSHVLSPLSTD